MGNNAPHPPLRQAAGSDAYDILQHDVDTYKETHEESLVFTENENQTDEDDESEVEYIGSVRLFCGGKLNKLRMKPLM